MTSSLKICATFQRISQVTHRNVCKDPGECWIDKIMRSYPERNKYRPYPTDMFLEMHCTNYAPVKRAISTSKIWKAERLAKDESWPSKGERIRWELHTAQPWRKPLRLHESALYESGKRFEGSRSSRQKTPLSNKLYSKLKLRSALDSVNLTFTKMAHDYVVTESHWWHMHPPTI